MKKIKQIRYWLDSYEEVEKATGELELGFDFIKEGLIEEEDIDKLYATAISLIEDLELHNMLRREEDKLGVVLKIN